MSQRTWSLGSSPYGDALSCAHMSHSGFFCISPDAMNNCEHEKASANQFGVEVNLETLGDAGINFEVTPLQMLGVIRLPGIL